MGATLVIGVCGATTVMPPPGSYVTRVPAGGATIPSDPGGTVGSVFVVVAACPVMVLLVVVSIK